MKTLLSALALQFTVCFVTSHLAMAQQEVLFNGKDLGGWTIHGTELWYVENGELVCESGPEEGYGYLSTDTRTKILIWN